MKIRFERNKTSSVMVIYSLNLYFLGLSLCNTSKAIIIFKDDKRSHVSSGIGFRGLQNIRFTKEKRISGIIIDETAVIQIGNQHFSL